MLIKSSAFENFSNIPEKFTCDGENISPPLRFFDIPQGTEELVLIVDDPDAPGGDWVHWLVYGIDPKTDGIEEGAVPNNSIQGKNTREKEAYGGPCPPSSTHHYFFKLYAINKRIESTKVMNKTDLENAIKGVILEKATLIGLYKRK